MSVQESKSELKFEDLGKDLLETLERYDVPPRDFLRLKNQFATSTKDNYIIKMLIGSKARELGSHGHLNEAIRYYNLLSTFVAVEDRDNPLETIRNMHSLTLRLYSRLGYGKVRINNCGEGGCRNCKKNHGKIIDISKAIKEMPLPVPGCSFDLYRNGHSFCRCTYEPIMQSVNFDEKKAIKNYRNFKTYLLPLAVLIFIAAIILYFLNLYS